MSEEKELVEWTKWQERRFWFKLWIKRLRLKSFGKFYIMGSFRQFSNEVRLGIQIHSKKFYERGWDEVRRKFVKKPRSIRFDLLVPWIEFGYYGRREPEDEDERS